MKAFKIILFSLTVISFAFTSCNKDQDIIIEPEELSMTTDEAAENMEAMVVNSVDDAEDAAISVEENYKMGDTLSVECGAVIDTTWTRTYATANASADYTSTWALTVLCNDFSIPYGLQMNSDANGTYEGPLMSGTEAGKGQFTWTGLLPADDEYTMEGEYKATGEAVSKKGRETTYSLESNIAFTELVFDKENKELLSGNGTFTLTASADGGATATFNGTIVFHGGGSATITVNGKSYTFQI